MVVSVAGTTELGDVDPVDEVQNYLDELKESKGISIWHHVDAAYGGFYLSMQDNLESILGEKVARSFNALKRTDSVTLDPHKLGYIPYSCGAIVVPSAANNGVSSFAAPYLENVKSSQNAWSSTIEGSRPGSGAAATWLTGTSLGFNREGLGSVLEKGIKAREQMRDHLARTGTVIRLLRHCDTNIVCFSLAYEGEKLSESNRRTENVFRHIADGDDFSVSKTTLDTESQLALIEDHVSQYNGSIDCHSMILIRTVLMNPFIVSKNTSFSYIEEFCAYLNKLLEKVEHQN
jgi:glutamate/tyrosine decarboxylase-like PLP-dependent enzyme